MNPLDKLAEYFTHLPGIGPRQAKRFVYYLLTRDQATLEALSDEIRAIKNNIRVCTECFRFFTASTEAKMCKICMDNNRDKSEMMIVPRDNDLETIEKSKAFDGVYFVLGGTIPILEKEPERRVRLGELRKRIERDREILKEVILATNLNPEGENTMDFLETHLRTLLKTDTRITHLGRGFSTGTEIEYSDSETIKYALKNRF